MNNTVESNENTIESINKPAKVSSIMNVDETVQLIQSIGFFLKMTDGSLIEQFGVHDTATQLYQAGNLLFRLSEGLLLGLDEITERFIALNEITANNPAIIAMNLPFTTTENQLKTILSLLNFNAPLPPLSEVDQISLQITLEQEAENYA